MLPAAARAHVRRTCVPRNVCHFTIRWRRAFECSPIFEVATLPHHSKTIVDHSYLPRKSTLRSHARHAHGHAAPSSRPAAPRCSLAHRAAGWHRDLSGRAWEGIWGIAGGARDCMRLHLRPRRAALSTDSPRPAPRTRRPTRLARRGRVGTGTRAADRADEVDWKWTAGGPGN